MAQCLVASMTTSSIEPSSLKCDRRYSEPRTSPTHPLSGCTGRVSPRTATGLFFCFIGQFCKWKKCLADSAKHFFRPDTFSLFDKLPIVDFFVDHSVTKPHMLY